MKKRYYVIIWCLTLVNTACVISIPLFVGTVLEDFASQRALDEHTLQLIGVILILSLCSYCLMLAIEYAQKYYALEYVQNVQVDLANQNLFVTEEQPEVGQAVELFLNDTQRLYIYYGIAYSQLVSSICLLFGIIGTVAYQNVWLAGGLLLILVCVYYLIKNINTDSEAILTSEKEQEERLTLQMTDYLALFSVLKLAKKMRVAIAKLQETLEQLKGANIAAQKQLYKVWISVILVINLLITFVFFVFGFGYFYYGLSFTIIYACINYIGLLSEPLENYQINMQAYQKCIISRKRIAEALMTSSNRVSMPSELDVVSKTQVLVVEKMTYTIGTDLIFTIDRLELHTGQRYLIRGVSGSGKSTFAQMFLSENYLQQDIYFWDGIQNQKHRLHRQNVQYISHDVLYFDDSVLDNLFMFDVTEYKRQTLQRLYDLEQDVMPHVIRAIVEHCLYGSDLEVNDTEKQIIHLLRVIFAQRSFIIFDESFAQLDSEIIRWFFRYFDQFMQQQIIVVISHEEQMRNFFQTYFLLENQRFDIRRWL